MKNTGEKEKQIDLQSHDMKFKRIMYSLKKTYVPSLSVS